MASKDDDVKVKDEKVKETVEGGKEEENLTPSGDVAANADEQPATTTDSTTVSANADQEAEEGDDTEKKRRVYVGNLAWEVSWQDLKDLMKTTNHEVVRCDVMQTSDGRSKGCGIVEFATNEGAAEAILTLNDTELSGRSIFVREDRETSNSGGTNSNPREHSSRDRNRNRHSGGGGGGGFHGNNNNNNSTVSSNPESQSCRVYVGNLSWDVSWPELKDHMKTAGEVVRADVISEHNGRSKGCGIVEYATEDEAQQAIATLTHTELQGRTIFVREDRERGGGGGGNEGGGGQHQQATAAAAGGDAGGGDGGSNSVYVWNLSYDVSWQDLKDHMRKAGNVDQATVLTGNDGTSIGCGIVVFQSARDAQRAIRELQESDLNGRPVRLREDRVSGTGGGGGRGAGRGGGRGGGRGAGRGGRTRGGGRNFSQPDNEDPVPEGTQLYVGNLSYSTTWRDLKNHFSQAGEIVRADVKTSDSGRSKGFGIVRFTRSEDAEAAISSLGGVELDGRSLEVRLDHKA